MPFNSMYLIEINDPNLLSYRYHEQVPNFNTILPYLSIASQLFSSMTIKKNIPTICLCDGQS